MATRLVLVVLSSLLATTSLLPAATLPAPRGSGGGVASAAPAATQIGLRILADGGNAVDAAVATALSPGRGPPLGRQSRRRGIRRGAAGRRDLEPRFPRDGARGRLSATCTWTTRGEPVREASWIGPLAAGIPGSPAGLYELHQRLGRLPWKAVVAPSITLARDGFVVTERLADSLRRARPLLTRFPETVAVWLPDGRAPAAGSVLRLPTLAATLADYAERGPEALTTGPIADAIVRASSRHGGILTAEDLADYRPVWRSPVRTTAFGWEIASMSLPSSGGLILAQTAAVLERLQWAELPRGGADRAHLLAETWRRAYADRFRLGDPSTTDVSPASLLATALLDRRAASIDRDAATLSDRVLPITPDPRSEPEETTHLSVVDDDGNAVSLTTTLNGAYGCGLLVPDAGFFLNNEMDDFAAAPGRPNAYGLVQGEANAVRPGRRMLSSMTPTIAWRGDEIIALGAPGGSRIPTGTMQVLFNLLVDDDELQAAVNRPRLHHQWRPDRLEAEEGALSPETLAVLETRGHLVVTRGTVGLVQAVQRRAAGEFRAAADPRGPGAAGVVTPAPGSNGCTP
jgi:gamma-glutamyltranspeptidase/glutathione hydrolase